MALIAIVDDDSMMQEVLQRLLAEAGHQTVVHPDGASALAGLAREKPDAVLLDVNLPDIGGHEVCRRLKQDPELQHVPVVIMTGEAREVEQRVRGLDLGADDYLFKPVSPKLLLSRLESLLR